MTGPVLRVDLDLLAANVRTVRDRIAPAELVMVVKDDAYGHGLEAVVDRARREGVRWFGAFDVETGVRVRAIAGDDARIFTWIPADAGAVAAAVAASLDVGVGDVAMLDDVAAVARAAGVRGRVHLETDTGLHRGGARPEDWAVLVARAAEHERSDAVEVVGVFSHLAEASDAEDDAARAAFDVAVEAARAAGLRPTLRHLTASAASLARPELRYELCRVGAFCYGIRPEGGPGEDELGIAPVGALAAEVVGVSDVAVTIAAGAADGIPSLLGRRLDVRTADGVRQVEHVGDHRTLVAPWPSARIGENVLLWGTEALRSATDAAELIGTIGEELAVRVSPRVTRRHLG